VQLRTLIGTVSPELAAAFPRSTRMRVWDVVGTGFDGTFVALGHARVGLGMNAEGVLSPAEERWRVARVWEVLRRLGPRAWSPCSARTETASVYYAQEPGEAERVFAAREFADLSQAERAVVLLMRALVGRPPLLLLDEPWCGMEAGMVEAARAYLRERLVEGSEERRGQWKGQAVVVVSHWEAEVPWSVRQGLRTFYLDGGVGRVVQ
jgi:ABC-type molybdenum transport system ATPase subunit/photorepair protein PhrA